MGFNYQSWDPSQESEGFTVLPAGQYRLMITASVEKPTKAGTGTLLELTYDVIEGPAKGRKIFETFNLVNPSPKAVEIARQQLAKLCRAINRMRITGPNDFLNAVFIGDVITKKQTWNGEEREKNEIRRYLPSSGAASVPASAPTTPTATAAVAPTQAPVSAPTPAPTTNGGKGKKPWEK